ncbi:MAG TPA: VWA domain-containing protein, partial [Planctomycetota bacterium]|nr:VWA domain-containing protein [Planctomycetota bacterium]
DRFLRGDVDQSTVLNLTDAFRMLESLFLGYPQPGCADAADANDDGKLDVTDPISIIGHLFQGGPPPPPPYPSCGPDPTEDPLRCEESNLCPEDLTFFGLSIDADGIFFVIDRSGSMQNTGELEVSKRQTIRATLAFQPEVQFGITFFDREILKFPSSDQPASAGDAAVINSARAFVQSAPGGGGTCGQTALLAALRFAKSSTAREKAIFYVSDGAGTCPGADEATYLRQTLEAVTGENAGIAAIHTIGLLNPQSMQEKYLKDLAERNGGTYTQIPR